LERLGILNSSYVERFLNDLKPQLVQHKKLMALLNFVEWSELFIEDDGGAKLPRHFHLKDST
jgi:hypothetical protein